MPSPEDLPPSSLLQKLQERLFGSVGIGQVQGKEAVGDGRGQGKGEKKGASPFPASTLVASVQSPRSQLSFLRFLIRVLGVADLLHKVDGPSPTLCVRSGAAERLLGADWAQILQTLDRKSVV